MDSQLLRCSCGQELMVASSDTHKRFRCPNCKQLLQFAESNSSSNSPSNSPSNAVVIPEAIPVGTAPLPDGFTTFEEVTGDGSAPASYYASAIPNPSAAHRSPSAAQRRQRVTQPVQPTTQRNSSNQGLIISLVVVGGLLALLCFSLGVLYALPHVDKLSNMSVMPHIKLSEETQYRDPHDALAVGTLDVDVMDFMIPDRAAELADKMRVAVVNDPDWLRILSSHAPPETLKYDARFGISEAEYTEYLELSSQISVHKAGESKLTITQTKPDVYSLDGGIVDGQHALVAGRHLVANLSNIEIDLGNNVVRTPFALLTEYTEEHASVDSPLGAWDGAIWSTKDDGHSRAIASLAVGRLRDSDRSFIYLSTSRLSSGYGMWIDLMVMYDLPPRLTTESQ